MTEFRLWLPLRCSRRFSRLFAGWEPRAESLPLMRELAARLLTEVWRGSLAFSILIDSAFFLRFSKFVLLIGGRKATAPLAELTIFGAAVSKLRGCSCEL